MQRHIANISLVPRLPESDGKLNRKRKPEKSAPTDP